MVPSTPPHANDIAETLTLTTHWVEFVRETLDEIQRRFEISVEMTYDSIGGRPFFRGTLSNGCHVLVPLVTGQLCAPPPLHRSLSNIWSPWTITDRNLGGTPLQVPVPWWSIKRDRLWFVDLTSDAKRDGHGGESTGWPDIALGEASNVDHRAPSLLRAGAIIVLQLREGHEDVDYGWYVRTRSGKELVEVPHAACVALVYTMRTDSALSDEALLETASRVEHLRADTDTSFNHLFSMAYGSKGPYGRYKDGRYRERNLKRGRDVAQRALPMSPQPHQPHQPKETCVVWLDDHESSQVRCRAGTCSAKICTTCNADARGLCVICDRGPINSVYPCGRCFTLTPLREYGYDCLNCDQASLCKDCFVNFRECYVCEDM